MTLTTVIVNGKHGVETGCLIDEGPPNLQCLKLALLLDKWDVEYYLDDICDEDGKEPTNWEHDYLITMRMAPEEEQLEWLIDLEDRMLDAVNDHIPHPYHVVRRDGCIFLEELDEEEFEPVVPNLSIVPDREED